MEFLFPWRCPEAWQLGEGPGLLPLALCSLWVGGREWQLAHLPPCSQMRGLGRTGCVQEDTTHLAKGLAHACLPLPSWGPWIVCQIDCEVVCLLSLFRQLITFFRNVRREKQAPPHSLSPWLCLSEVTSGPAPVGPSPDCQPSHWGLGWFLPALLVLLPLNP